MTDGVQRVFGMEYRPVKDLQVLAPAGLKVCFFKRKIKAVEMVDKELVYWFFFFC